MKDKYGTGIICNSEIVTLPKKKKIKANTHVQILEL